MDCDIYAIVERKLTYLNRDGQPYWHEWINAGDPDIGRNYEIFAALAGVRNDVGLEPIAEPRGIPSFKGRHSRGWLEFEHYGDAPCSMFQAYFEQWYDDAHSASWLTLAEIKAYDTTQTVDDPSLIVGRGEDGRVTMTAGWTTGPHEGKVGLRRIFTWPGGDDDQVTGWDRLVAYLEGVRAMHNLSDEEVRLVFFFDN